MNKFIKEQLQKVTIPMSSWDSNTIQVFIPKQSANSNKNTDFELYKSYNIVIEDYIINPPPTFTLASNWNFGTTPPEKELSATVLQIVGKMIKFKCIGKTTNIEWEGWLPKKSIKIL